MKTASGSPHASLNIFSFSKENISTATSLPLSVGRDYLGAKEEYGCGIEDPQDHQDDRIQGTIDKPVMRTMADAPSKSMFGYLKQKGTQKAAYHGLPEKAFTWGNDGVERG